MYTGGCVLKNAASLVCTYTHAQQPTILNDNVNQFKVGLETDNGHFTLKVKTVMFMSHFFCSQ
jgi:hypothetical protein